MRQSIDILLNALDDVMDKIPDTRAIFDKKKEIATSIDDLRKLIERGKFVKDS